MPQCKAKSITECARIACHSAFVSSNPVREIESPTRYRNDRSIILDTRLECYMGNVKIVGVSGRHWPPTKPKNNNSFRLNESPKTFPDFLSANERDRLKWFYFFYCTLTGTNHFPRPFPSDSISPI